VSRTRLDALLAGGACGPLAGDCRIIETHVSWVVLSGALAWKIKKPVNLGFLDFSSLAARRHACEEELRLNRRLAPDLYLDVVELRAQPPASGVDRPEPIVEYAVKMRRFPDGAAVGSALAASLTAAEAVQLGGLIGGFHGTLPRDLPFREWGSADATWAAIDSSLLQMSGLVAGGMQERVNRCRSFLGSEFARRRGFITERQRSGAVRECHGDLHLGNLVRLEGRIVPFDALEFDPALRWIDVMNEVAFLLMDLDVRARRDLAFHFLNSWLDATGDFAGLAGLRLYLAYRALVRAKVGGLGPLHAGAGNPDLATLLDYAAAPLAGMGAGVVVMSGISGSGKSWLAGRLAPLLPAVHIRSDVERKRIAGLAPLARTGSAPQAGIYAPAVSSRVYAHLAGLAGTVAAAGLPVILDATNLRRADRGAFIAAARQAGVRALVLSCTADAATLEARVRQRAQEARDPSEAGVEVLRGQLQQYEPPGDDEGCPRILVDTKAPTDVAALVRRISPLLHAAHEGTTPAVLP